MGHEGSSGLGACVNQMIHCQNILAVVALLKLTLFFAV